MKLPVALQPKLRELAKHQGCTVRQLVVAAVEEMIAAFTDDTQTTKPQRGESLMDARRRLDAQQPEVVWNGAMSRQGKSLVGSIERRGAA